MVDIDKDKYLATMLAGFFCLQPLNMPMSDIYMETPISLPISRLGLILNYTQYTMAISFFISFFIITMIILFTDFIKQQKIIMSILVHIALCITNFLLLLAYIYYTMTNIHHIYDYGLIFSAAICGVALPLFLYVTYEYIMIFNVGNFLRDLLFASFNLIKPLIYEAFNITIQFNTIVLTKLVIMVIISILSTYFYCTVYLKEIENANGNDKGKATENISEGNETEAGESNTDTSEINTSTESSTTQPTTASATPASGTNTPTAGTPTKTSTNGNTNAINASTGGVRKGSSSIFGKINDSVLPIMMASASNLIYLCYPGIFPYSLITTDLAITLDLFCIVLLAFVSIVLHSLCYDKDFKPNSNWDQQPQWQYAWIGIFPIIIVVLIFILATIYRHLLNFQLLNKLLIPTVIMLILSILSSNLMANVGLSGCGSQVEEEYKDKMTVFGVFVYYGSLLTVMTIFRTYLTRDGYGAGVGLPMSLSQSNEYPSDTADQDMIVFTRM